MRKFQLAVALAPRDSLSSTLASLGKIKINADPGDEATYQFIEHRNDLGEK